MAGVSLEMLRHRGSLLGIKNPYIINMKHTLPYKGEICLGTTVSYSLGVLEHMLGFCWYPGQHGTRRINPEPPKPRDPTPQTFRV